MDITTAASALPSNGVWGSFASRLLEGISATRDHCQQNQALVAVGETVHPGVLADMEAAEHRYDAAWQSPV